jgi:hypothetical protein
MEIDIIELLKRENKGKAPKVIEIAGTKFYSSDIENDIEKLYIDDCGNPWFTRYIDVNTKIKILDKPVIEEIPLIEIKHDYSNGSTNDTYEVERAITNEELARKINEIIHRLNKEEK